MPAVIPETDANSAADTVPTIGQSELDSALINSWLEWQGQMVSGIIRSAIYRVDDIALNSTLAIWPATGAAEPLLVAAATQAAKQQKSSCFSKISYGPKNKRLCDVVACPVYKRGQIIAIVAFSFSVRSSSQQQAVIQLIGWGGVWLDTLTALPSQNASKCHEFVTALNRSVAQQDGLLAAAIETVNKLARSTDCDRVSIGFTRSLRVKVTAISGTQRFDTDTESLRKLEAVMDECADQQCPVQYAAGQSDLLSKAHQKLGSGCTLSLPLKSAGKPLGVIVFERAVNQAFDQNTVDLLVEAVDTVSITLAHKREIETPISAQISRKITSLGKGLIGPRFFISKALAMLLITLLVLSANIQTQYRISAASKVEGSIQQAVVAASNSFVEASYIRAGDSVEKGQLMAVLDTRHLTLKKSKLLGEIESLKQNYNTALAGNQKSEIAISRAKLSQLEAEIKLLDNEQGRARIKAPISGVVTSGDLSQSTGSPVALGEQLFQVSPLQNYRVSLEVQERDIAKLKIGLDGYLVAEAFPDQKFWFKVDSISPMADSNRNGSFYKVEAKLQETTDRLLPGMQGFSKIQSGEQTILWIWTHRLLQSLKLSAWKLGL